MIQPPSRSPHTPQADTRAALAHPLFGAALLSLCALGAAAALTLHSQAHAQQGDDKAAPKGGDSTPGQFDHLFDDENLEINIEKEIEKSERKPPIAVPPPLGPDGQPGQLGEMIAEVLRLDFQISGEFTRVKPDKLDLDLKEGLQEDEIDFNAWNSKANARYLVKGRYAPTPEGRFAIDLRLYEVWKGRRAELKWSPQDPVTLEEARDLAHHFANAVHTYMTGKTTTAFGTRLAVAALEDDQKHIYTLDMDGARQIRVTENTSINVLPSWGRDGGLYYTSYLRDNPDLYFVQGDAAPRIVSSIPGTNHGAALCGDRVALTLSMGGTNTDIYLLDANNGRIKARLTRHWGIDTSPTWSPDCSRIAFVSDRSAKPQIYTMNADGSDQRRLTFSGQNNTTPAWSPDGEHIAFSGFTGRGTDVFTSTLDGYIRRLTFGGGSNEHPTWSPDSQFIAFISRKRGKNPRLTIMPTSGIRRTPITSDDGIFATPSWQP